MLVFIFSCQLIDEQRERGEVIGQHKVWYHRQYRCCTEILILRGSTYRLPDILVDLADLFTLLLQTTRRPASWLLTSICILSSKTLILKNHLPFPLLYCVTLLRYSNDDD